MPDTHNIIAGCGQRSITQLTFENRQPGRSRRCTAGGAEFNTLGLPAKRLEFEQPGSVPTADIEHAAGELALRQRAGPEDEHGTTA
ncbi:MAG: hypothetical protein KatS3mg057_1316 [Herpetosiphonaceae bacterium]|nr:MAG: hypothetical protein KatS3mg057_1316 [Herpetosiphonaceae bacterium]